MRVIGYPDVVGRLAPNSALSLDQLDPGIRECVLARLECRAYEYHIANETRVRTGGFFLDWLNFKRTTEVNAWQFDAVVAVRNGVVLFRNYGGAPHNERTERQVNPLGPLQGSGDAIPGLLRWREPEPFRRGSTLPRDIEDRRSRPGCPWLA